MNDTAPSRTQLKKADRELRELGEALTGLSPENLGRMGLPETLLSAIRLFQDIRSHSARRRQQKTIGALLRDMDIHDIRIALEGFRQGDRSRARRHQRLERWRDDLKAGDMTRIEEIVAACPGVERQRLTQLARNAAKEAAAGTGVKASRSLFRYLDDVAED